MSNKEENPIIMPVLWLVSFLISFFFSMKVLKFVGLESSSPYHWWSFLLITAATTAASFHASRQVYNSANKTAKLVFFFAPWLVGAAVISQAPESNSFGDNAEIVAVIIVCYHLLIELVAVVCLYWMPKQKVKRETKMTARKELLEKQISAQIERDKQAKNIIEEAKSRISACKNSGSFLE